jgi:hypothetical protein
MAAPTAFKQQCPSCEALVPIRDPNLVGRKIDCPKCKYRFEVEAPPDDDDGDEAPSRARKKSGAIQKDKPSRAGGAGVQKEKPGKGGSTATQKDRPSRRRAAEAEDDGDKPRPKKKGGASRTTVLGIGLAAVAVIALGVGGFFLFRNMGGGGGGKKPGGGGGGGGDDQVAAQDKDKKDKGEGGGTSNGPAGADITNYLHPRAQGVWSIHLDALLRTSLKDVLLSRGGPFRKEAFAAKFTLPPDAIVHLVQAWNLEENWVWTVVRTSEPVKLEQLQKSLNLKQEGTINARTYYTVQGPFDSLGNLLFKGGRPHERFSFYQLDDKTLIFADSKPLQEFLNTKEARWKRVEQPEKKEDKKEEKKEDKKPDQAGEKDRSGGDRPKDRPMPTPMGGGLGPRDAGGDRPGDQGGDKKGDKKEEKSAEPSGSYLTIDPALKGILDRMEGEQGSLISVAFPLDGKTAVQEAQQDLRLLSAGDPQMMQLLSMLELAVKPIQKEIRATVTAVKEVNRGGLALQSFKTEKKEVKVEVVFALDTGNDDSAAGLEEASKRLYDKLLELAQSQGPPVGPDGPPMPDRGPPFRDRPPGPDRGIPGPIGAGGGDRGPPKYPPDRSGPRGPDRGGPMSGDRGGEDQPPPPLTIQSVDSTVLYTVNAPIPRDGPFGFDQTKDKAAEPLLVWLKAQADMVDLRTRIHDLAAATQRYLKEKGSFPPGAVERPLGDRVAPWPPEERMSWMQPLLPYLGGESSELGRFRVDPTASWKEGKNLLLARVVVPAYVVRTRADTVFLIPYPGVNGPPVAAGHYVGVAGVGPDAAEYDPKNPAVARKLGVFGYDRVTKPEDIKDGLENTILLLQVPAGPTDQKSPWLAGGGATVRGVSEDENAIRPFVCIEYKGKKGACAVMCDGRVRFIPEDVNPDVFRAMCTIAGDEKTENLDELCPVIPSDQTEVKADKPADPKPEPKKPEPEKDKKAEPEKDKKLADKADPNPKDKPDLKPKDKPADK